MKARSLLQSAILSIRFVRFRRSLIKFISLICLCAGLFFCLQYSSSTVLAQSQPTQARQSEVDRLVNKCSQLNKQANYQQALRICQDAIAATRAANDRQEASALNNLGEAYRNLEQYAKAIEFYQASRLTARAIDNRQLEANALNNLGSVYHSLGQYAKAIKFCQQSRLLARVIDNRQVEASALNNLGNAYNSLGQYAKAIEFYQASRLLARAIDNRQLEATALNNSGEAYRNLGQYAKAIEFYQASLSIARTIDNRQLEATALNNSGIAYRNLGQYAKAIEFYQASRLLARAIDNRQVEASALSNLGNAYNSLGQYAKAIEFYQASRLLARVIDNRQLEASALSNLGNVLRITKRLTEAERYLRQSIKIFESLRLNLSDAEKLSHFETLTNPYYRLQWVLAAQKKTEEALVIAEGGRTRAFAELLAQRLAPTDTQNLAQAQINAPITLEQIKQVAHNQNATLVEYSIAHSSRLYIWVVSPTGNITFRWVDLSKLQTSLKDLATKTNSRIGQGTRQTDTALSLLVQGTRGAIDTAPDTRTTDPNRPDSFPAIAADDPRFTDGLKQLYQLLIDPIKDLLPTKPEDHVIFIPHNALFLVPFPALQAPDDSYLIQHYTIRTAPSIQVLHLTHQQQQQRHQVIQKALIVGNPTSDLPAAEREAKAVADLLNTVPLLGKQATKAEIVKRMPQADLIHLAAHAAPTAKDTSYGGLIVLADPTRGSDSLTTSEILQLQLQAELVVLSGCNTGVSDIINSDGVVGLARSIITAGTPSVVMSLWQVPDAPTALLMQEFYRHWQPGRALWITQMLPLLIGVLILLFLLRKRVSGWKLRKLTQFQWQQIPRQFLTALRHFPQQVIELRKRGSRLVSPKPNPQDAIQFLSSCQNSFQQIRYLRQHHGLVTIVVLSVAFLSFSLAPHFDTQGAIDKAQALRESMLTTMKTHPEPAAWAAFTLMGEAR